VTSLQQSLPRMASSDVPPPASFGAGKIDNFTSLLRARTPVRLRVLVTSELARHWLDKTNLWNRPLSEMHWMKIWLDIVEGRWKYNGEPISFGTNGALLNGQHRLQACAESGAAIDTDVIFGLDPDVMSTIDIGKVRTAANIAHLEGIENATAACAAAHLILLHENGGIQQLGNKQVEPSKTKINERVRTDPQDLRDRRTRRRHGPRPCLAACDVVLLLPFQRQQPELAEHFFSRLASGAGLTRHDPVYLLGSGCAPTTQGRRSCPCSKSWHCSSRRGSPTAAASREVSALEQRRG